MKMTSKRFSLSAIAVAATVLTAGMTLWAPGTADAKTTVNTFTFKGVYPGTLKLSPSSMDCSFGKTYNGKSYLVTLTHMKGTITGAGKGPWAFTAYVPKKGTTRAAHANVHALNDTSFQNSGSPIIAFDETSGTITYKGDTGSVSLTVMFRPVGGSTASNVPGSDTVTGSWNCPQALDLGG
jgi:hypothetical protein